MKIIHQLNDVLKRIMKREVTKYKTKTLEVVLIRIKMKPCPTLSQRNIPKIIFFIGDAQSNNNTMRDRKNHKSI